MPGASYASGWRFATGTSVAVVVIVAASLPLWAPSGLGSAYLPLALPLLLGVGVFVFMATVNGSLAGSDSWTGVAFIIGLDGLLRLGTVGLALLWTDDPVWLAWMVVAPLPVTLVVAGVLFHRSIRGSMALADRYRTLSWNVVRTMTASAGSAMLITGFPLLLAIVATDREQRALAPLILAITLTRAPLLMPLSAFQGFLVVQFAKKAAAQWRLVVTLAGVLAGIGAVGAVLAWWIGPGILKTLFGPAFALDGGVLASLVAAAGAISALYITGPAVLARGAHASYALGWIGAVVVALLSVNLSGDLTTRAVLALTLGPVSGVFIHLVCLLMIGRGRRNRVPKIGSLAALD